VDNLDKMRIISLSFTICCCSNPLSLLGHNGAGKTTTISLITGMIEKTNGSILVEGKELEDDVGEARRKMGLCT